jgi:hypothetical protein
MTTNKTQEAIEEFGAGLVYEVIEIVSVSDADGAYTMFGDMGIFDHQACVEMLYFDGSDIDADDEAQDWDIFGENKI